MTPVLIIAPFVGANTRGDIAYFPDETSATLIASGKARRPTPTELLAGRRIQLGEPGPPPLKARNPIPPNADGYRPGPDAILLEVTRHFGGWYPRDKAAFDPVLAEFLLTHELARRIPSAIPAVQSQEE